MSTSQGSKRGKRIQVYLAADLVERWERLPRYERSKIVAAALRKYWGLTNTDTNTNTAAEDDERGNTPQ